MTTSAEEKASPGFAEFRFDDGAYIGVAANGGTVSVIQMQGSTQGRGAAFLSGDQARQLAAAILEAAVVADKQPKESAPPTVVPVAAGPALTIEDIVSAVRRTVDEQLAAAGVKATPTTE